MPGALRDVDKSIQLNRGVGKVWNRKGFIHQENGDYKGALEAYAQALSLSSADTDAAVGFVASAQSMYTHMSADARNRAAHFLSQSDVQSVVTGSDAALTVVTSPETREKLRQVASQA